MGYFNPFTIGSFLVSLAIAYHSIRNGKSPLWLMALAVSSFLSLFATIAVWLAYLVFAVIPDMLKSNSAQIFFYVGGAQPADWNTLSDLARVVLLFDGRDAQALASARAAWKDAKAAGHDVTYWKETPNGKFEKQN